MKFEIKNRWSGAVFFTAEIDCAEDALMSVKLGLAVRFAVEKKANLSGANLSGADLSGADLSGADLSGAYLSGAYLSDLDKARLLVPPQEGAFTAFKKLRGGIICKLLIPAEARRSSATTRKCRAEFAVVLEGEGISQHDEHFKYIVGETVRPHEWCDDRWQECAGGIHFFLTREEAEAY